MSKVDQFESLKQRVEDLQLQLSEAKGHFASTKQTAKQEFGTDDPKELRKLQEKYKTKIEKLETKIEKLSEELEELLDSIEQEDDEEDDL